MMLRLLLIVLLLFGTATSALAADRYVRSTDGSDADNGTTWALAKATVTGALAIAAAGDRIFVSQAHASTQASAVTWTSPGTAAAPVQILCANDAAEPPTALATTCTVTTTGASNILFAGHASVYGITFNTGTGAVDGHFGVSAGGSWWWKFDTCVIKLLTTVGTSGLYVGWSDAATNDSGFEWVDTSVQFGGVNQTIHVGSRLRWNGGSLLLGTAPTNGLLSVGAGRSSDVEIVGVDFSNIGTNPLVNVVTGSQGGTIDIRNSKIASGTTLTTGTSTGPGHTRIRLTSSDSGDTNYRMQTNQYAGNVYSETGVVRTGGASDGTTALSWRMVSSAGASFTNPLASPEILMWNETTGSAQTITFHIVHDNATPLTDGDVWVTCGHRGTSGFPITTAVSDRKANTLTAATNQTTSTATWTGTGGFGTVNKQQLSVTVTSQGKGLRSCRMNLAKPSYTIYGDPKMVLE